MRVREGKREREREREWDRGVRESSVVKCSFFLFTVSSVYSFQLCILPFFFIFFSYCFLLMEFYSPLFKYFLFKGVRFFETWIGRWKLLYFSWWLTLIKLGGKDWLLAKHLLKYFWQTPLHLAAYCGYQGCVEKLLQSGANKSLKNVWNRFSLMVELWENQRSCWDHTFSRKIESYF